MNHLSAEQYGIQDFDYEGFEYRGFKVSIDADYSPEDPYSVFDSMPPALIYGDRLYAKGEITLSAPELTDREIDSNLSDILLYLGYGDIQALKDDVYGNVSDEGVYELINDYLSESLSENVSTQRERVEALKQFYDWKGYTTVTTTHYGYCQGDWMEITAVLTPEWLERVGLKQIGGDTYGVEDDNAMYAAWAFGQCFTTSFELEGPSRNFDEPLIQYRGTFYGDDHFKSGLVMDAKEAIDDYLEVVA